jgi:inner membrane transporter RhtA
MTLEFLGPLSVALVGGLTATPTGMRRRVVLGCAVLAAAGVVLLARPQPTTDYLGIGLGLFAAACWASYILLNRTVGERFTGVEGTAAAVTVSALVYVPIGTVALIAHPPTVAALACGATAGVLASVVPFVADVLALRRVPTHFFGIFMSVNPVFAATIGATVLAESLGALDWIAIGLIVAANVGVVVTTRPGMPSVTVAPVPHLRAPSVAIGGCGDDGLGSGGRWPTRSGHRRRPRAIARQGGPAR